MGLKSFPRHREQRKTIWCLSNDTIDKSLEDESMANILLDSPLTIVRYPLRGRDSSNELLVRLDNDNILKENAVLILDKDSTDEHKDTYLTVDDIIQNHIDTILKKAHAYADFFSTLGATEFAFEYENNGQYNHSLNGKVELSSKLVGLDGSAKREIDNKINELTNIKFSYNQKAIDRDVRIRLAEDILNENDLQNDVACKKIIDHLKRNVSDINDYTLKICSSQYASKNVELALDLGLNIKLPTGSPSKLKTWTSLFDLKAKIDSLSVIKNDFNFELKVSFK